MALAGLHTYWQGFKVGVHQVIGPCSEENLSHHHINPLPGRKPKFVQPPAKKKRQTTRRWNCCHRPSPTSSGSRKQELGHDADFVKNYTTNLNSSLALIILKINFRPPLTGGLSWWEHLFCSPACPPSPGRQGTGDGKQNPASAPQLVKGLRAERNHSQPQGCLWLPGFDCSASRPWWKDHHALQEGKKYCNHGFG